MYVVKYFDPVEEENCINYFDTQGIAEEFRDLMLKFGMEEVTMFEV